MNRRTFLKSIAAACGTAIVCPGELLKPPIKFRPNPVQRVYVTDCIWLSVHNNIVYQGIPVYYQTPLWSSRDETIQTAK